MSSRMQVHKFAVRLLTRFPDYTVLHYATESTESAPVFNSRQCSDAHSTLERQSGLRPRILPVASASLGHSRLEAVSKVYQTCRAVDVR